MAWLGGALRNRSGLDDDEGIPCHPLTMTGAHIAEPHVIRVQVYYPDTDHTGVVYHANYLNYFERAREDLIGVDEIKDILRQGIGFVVYKVEMRCRRSAVYGDRLEVRSRATIDNDYQLVFHHKLYRDDQLLVDADILLASVDQSGQLVALPDALKALVGQYTGASQ